MSTATQSDISTETFQTYESRINETRIARKNARVAKLKEIKIKNELKLEKLAMENKKINNHTLIDEKTKFIIKSNNIFTHKVKFPQSLRTVLRDNYLTQFFFGCSFFLVVGFLLFVLFSEPTERNPMLINKYRWSFGLQLTYNRGPPPI